VRSADVSPDGRWIITGGADGWVKVWAPETQGSEFALARHAQGVLSVGFSMDGQRIFTCGWTGTVNVWEGGAPPGGGSPGRQVFTLRSALPFIRCVALSPDRRRLVAGRDDGTAVVWDLDTQRQIILLKRHTDTVTCIAFSPDGRRIITGSDDSTVRVWDATSGRETLTLKGHTRSIRSVAVTTGGRRIMSFSVDGSIRFWDAASASEIARWTDQERILQRQLREAQARREAAALARASEAARRNTMESGSPGRTVQGNLLINGSFESGPKVHGYLLFPVGSAALPGWQIIRGSVETIGNYWLPSQGDRSLDLDGTSFGAIRQMFPTVPGQRYRVTFDLAANPDWNSPPLKRLRVRAAGETADFAFDATGRSHDEMGWVARSWQFTADGERTALDFISLDTMHGFAGPALDNISVIPVRQEGAATPREN
jgi:choice-of-anchor C domain-containing protein